MFKNSRRSFIEKLALGAGATLLAPLATKLVSEAQGAPQTRKRAVFVFGNQGIRPEIFQPVEFGPSTAAQRCPPGGDFRSYTLPDMVKPLEKYRQRMLLVDGLYSRIPASQHTGGYAAFSCVPVASGTAEYGGPPGGITIDQFIGAQIGKDTPFRTVLYGADMTGKAVNSIVFASGPNKPESHYLDPRLLYSKLFGGLTPNAGSRRRLVMDALRNDLNKLQANLAGPERLKLDHYVAAMEDFEHRQALLPSLSCKAPDAPARDMSKTDPEDRLLAMNEMAILALICGITNVVGLCGCGYGHGPVPMFDNLAKRMAPQGFEVGYFGHGPLDKTLQGTPPIHALFVSFLARFADALSQIKEGDKTMFDNSVMLYTTDNGEDHHGAKERWPVVVLGDGGGLLKADGRYIRYGKGGCANENHTLAELFTTVAYAMGVPGPETFATNGFHPNKGPIPSLVAR